MQRITELKLMDFERATHMLLSQRCPSRTRAVAAAFIANAFVDNLPQQDCCAVVRFQDWSQLQTPLLNSADHSRQNTQQFAVLQAFSLVHLECNDVQGLDFDTDCLLEETLKLTYFLVRYGFYSITVASALAFCDADQNLPCANKTCFSFMKQRITALWASTHTHQTLDEWAQDTLLCALLIQPLWLVLDAATDQDVTSMDARARLLARLKPAHGDAQSCVVQLCIADNSPIEHRDVVIGIYICVHRNMHVHIYVTYVNMYIYKYTCMYIIHIYIYIYMYTYIFYVFIYILVYI